MLTVVPRVRCLHLVCVDDQHVTERADGQFSTGYWKLGADAALSAESLALHPARGRRSVRQGRIVGRHLMDHEGGKRYLFVVSPDPDPVEWEGAGSVEKGDAA